MNKTLVTNAIVQEGYKEEPALKFFGEDDKCVSFQVSEPYYDPKADKKTGWNNWYLKAFGIHCERIKKMKLKAGSRISFSGSIKTESWRNKENEKRQRNYVLLDDIEYCSSGGKKSQDGDEKQREESEPKEEMRTESSENPRDEDTEADMFSLLDEDDDLPFL